jgi:glutathione S-transferase
MLLYTCGQKKRGGSLGHPCGKAAKALDRAGFEYGIKVVRGYRWSRGSTREEARTEVRELSGANEVPILVLDDGEVIAGSATIARWAQRPPDEKPAAESAA